MASEDVTVTRIIQNDIPYVVWYLPWGHSMVKVYHDPFNLEVRMIELKEGREEIKAHDSAVNLFNENKNDS